MGMLSQREFKADKKKNFSEWYNTIIYAADLADVRYNVQGFIVHKPWSMFIIKKIYSLFEEALEKDGHKPVLFPLVIPEENFEKEKEHVEGFSPNVFWVTEAGGEKLKRKLALRPTSETAFYQLYSLWIQSRSDLPLKLYQSTNMFRFEAETNPFLRGREFLWIEAHDAFATEEESKEQVGKDLGIAKEILLQHLGLPVLIFKRPDWDKFPGAVETYACDCLLPDGKAFQVATTHLLGQNFSKPFDIKFVDEKGGKHFVFQTCFGPGIWRMVGALVSIHGDERGLVLPFSLSPVQAVIIPIPRKASGSEKLLTYCREMKKRLEKKFIVDLDDSEKTPGYKYNEWEMRGVPIRIEVGEKELKEKTLTLARRDTRERIGVKEGDAEERIKDTGNSIFQNLVENAERELKENIRSADSREELKKMVEKGGFVKLELCSLESEGKECADIIKYETGGGKVRGTLYGENQKPAGKCIICGKAAKAVAYVAKQY
ncbi:proline--tRNA ligase [Candidatus Micrarchaeota archaeon]|nr:proline--tRNA ligase [Candidatus Micrarchaeota archaeon]